ncbi:hypothetical protein [Xenorhabdus lircayensis]|uniref:Uncharacterized protein n=1 Tax=Xenorhabdus lircayensis TaxID=2763499 RepID=A0ABS0U366_9GAMM|nr:hypothetical protein [Xenorhabdus lircayensis]MBI6547388.1 hypothetical protein [Xenorhabdus lircayensis]
MAKHIHADLMMKASEIAQTDAEWWKYFEVLHDDADRWESIRLMSLNQSHAQCAM